jgi:hypothetical protein
MPLQLEFENSKLMGKHLATAGVSAGPARYSSEE